MLGICKCEKINVSAHDLKCRKCRTPRQQRYHIKALVLMVQGLTYEKAIFKVRNGWIPE